MNNKGKNRREFIQKLGLASLAAGSGMFSIDSFSKTSPQEKIQSNAESRLKIFNGRIITP